MLPLRHEKRWRQAGIALLLAVSLAMMTPTIWLWPFVTRSDFVLMDKWLHLLTFLMLTVWFAGQYGRRSYWRLLVGLTAFGGLIELGQGLLAYRTAEWQDLFADMLGIGAGLVVALAGAGGWSLRFEEWLAKWQVGID